VIIALTAVSHNAAKYVIARPLRPAKRVGVNNLPEVVARQHGADADVAAARVCNDLPPTFVNSPSLLTFKILF